MASQKDETASTGQNTKLPWILLTIGGVVIILLIVLVIFLVSSKNDRPASSPVSEGRGTVVNEDNVEEIKKAMEQPVRAAYYEAVMNNEWKFENANKASSNAYVENSEANEFTVYFDVTLEETGELVYSSPYIPVGEYVDDIKLDTYLEPGEYPAVVTYHLVDDDENHTELSTVSVGVTLFIES